MTNTDYITLDLLSDLKMAVEAVSFFSYLYPSNDDGSSLVHVLSSVLSDAFNNLDRHIASLPKTPPPSL